MAITKWTLESDPVRRRRYGKLNEELGELMAVVARCDIQGVDEIDPSSGKTNRQRLHEEIADVLAQCDCTINALKLDRGFIGLRQAVKIGQMAEWEALSS